MKPFKYVLKSLFNNAVIIEGRKRKWIESFILFIIAMIIALIPSTVSGATIKGSAIINANSNGVDEGLRYFSETMHNKNMSLKIKAENKTKIITIIENGEEKWGDDPYCFNNRDEDKYFFYERFDREYNDDGYVDKKIERLRVYLSIDLDAKAVGEKIKNIQSQETSETNPVSSFLIIGKTNSYLCLYSKSVEKWSNPTAARYITYDRFDDGQEVMTSPSYYSIKETENHKKEYLEKWGNFINVGYTSTKISSVFSQMGIFAAINVLVSLFMTLMIFIVTRGKRNPYRDYKFVEAMKIVGIASLAPSIISAIVGFILPAYSSMLFMILLGIRIMWLTSKNLNPAIEKK